eukprot:Gregarina_sp_Poly_1__10216@NODE_708_length_6677_cov_81_679879_g535_i0_p1_GENE_NODE_708_length_6677_cov_81_679879_g535_i0NODE_708_length_6677_cov_81_679879_g535_i0_p1_ORF_typecomplete_len528_score42_68_NODE_708_length_6677_cov_81_679879_g535_i023283911
MKTSEWTDLQKFRKFRVSNRKNIASRPMRRKRIAPACMASELLRYYKIQQHIEFWLQKASPFQKLTILFLLIPIIWPVWRLISKSDLVDYYIDEHENFRFRLNIRRSPERPVRSVLYLSDITQPLVCENIFLHVATANFEDNLQLWIRRQLEWINFTSNDCFFSITPEGVLPKYHAITTRNPYVWYKTLGQSTYRIRYDVQVALSRMGLAGYLGRTNSKDGSPWIHFTDIDVMPLDKRKTIGSLVARIEAGLQLGQTTEDRLCGAGAGTEYFGCLDTTNTAKISTDQVAYVIALDNVCQSDWMFNAGSVLWKPSRVLGMMGQSILRLFNDTSSLSHAFDDSDQGRIGLVLRELFGLDPDRVRALCAPFQVEAWYASSEGDEILFLRRFNLSRALTHPTFSSIAAKWFPEGRLWPEEPDAVAIVNPRWMNSAACYVNSGYSPTRRRYQMLNCGDMLAHFNGCSKEEYFDPVFRRLVTSTPSCVENLPFLTNDDGSAPFDPERWVRESKEPKRKNPLFREPTRRMQFGK